MKSRKKEQKCWRERVAPPVGAWIEILMIFSIPVPLSVAPPVGAWIEIMHGYSMAFSRMSLPPWERGLKSLNGPEPVSGYPVAPPVGAWIEIGPSRATPAEHPVAPPVGAWIEISFFAQDTPPDGVAPLAEGELKKVNLELLVSSNALM